MGSINNEAANTRKMREHQQKKLLQQSNVVTHEETDLMMCSSVINLGNSVALNTNENYASLIQVMMANPRNLSLVSDVDHQLLLKISFKDPVTLTAAGFRAEFPPTESAGGKTVEGNSANISSNNDTSLDPSDYSGPKRIKCYPNLEELDFIDTESTTPAQEILLNPAQLSGERVALRGNRFSRCLSVQFFIEENQGDTVYTFLNRLCLWGRISPAYHLD